MTDGCIGNSTHTVWLGMLHQAPYWLYVSSITDVFRGAPVIKNDL